MIDTVLVLPSPRALLPSLSVDDPVPELRAACAAAIGRVLSEQPGRIVVVAAPVSAQNEVRGVTEPLGHRVARHLLGTRAFDAEVAGPGTAAALLAIDEPTVVLVMADGSASRGEKAPGHLHPDAVAFDDQIDAALRSGDVEVLAALDADQATELWCEGVPGFHVLAELARGRRIEVEIGYADAPYGVAWWVARWDLGGTSV